MLDLETVYKALYDVARVDYDERVFVEGAAGGTGIYAVACAALRGARVTGLVSTEEKGAPGARARRAWPTSTARTPALAGAFVPVPRERAGRARLAERRPASWSRWCAIATSGALTDVVVSSVGRDLFPRMIDLLAPSGRLVFYGATSGYTLTFLGKPGSARAGEMMRRAGLRPASRRARLLRQAARSPTRWATMRSARPCTPARAWPSPTRTDAEAAAVKAAHRVAGVVSLETLARDAAFRWPDDHAGLRRGPRRLSRVPGPHAQAVRAGGRPRAGHARQSARQPRHDRRAGRSGHARREHVPGPAVHRGSWSISRPPPTTGCRSTRRTCGCTRSACCFPRSRSWAAISPTPQQADEVVRLLDAGALTTQPPAVESWDALAEANQAIHENRHAGTITVRAWGPPVRSTRPGRRARCTRRGARASSMARPCACASIPCARARRRAWRW